MRLKDYCDFEPEHDADYWRTYIYTHELRRQTSEEDYGAGDGCAVDSHLQNTDIANIGYKVPILPPSSLPMINSNNPNHPHLHSQNPDAQPNERYE